MQEFHLFKVFALLGDCRGFCHVGEPFNYWQSALEILAESGVCSVWGVRILLVVNLGCVIWSVYRAWPSDTSQLPSDWNIGKSHGNLIVTAKETSVLNKQASHLGQQDKGPASPLPWDLSDPWRLGRKHPLKSSPVSCLPCSSSFRGLWLHFWPLEFLCRGQCCFMEGSWKPGAGGPVWRRYRKLPATPEPAEASEASCGISKCLRTPGHTTSGHLTESLLNTNCISWAAVTKYHRRGRFNNGNAFVHSSGS